LCINVNQNFAEAEKNERDIQFDVEILVGGAGSECVRDCTEKMEDCVIVGVDDGDLRNNHFGMGKYKYAN
jgi:hypothetical protein